MTGCNELKSNHMTADAHLTPSLVSEMLMFSSTQAREMDEGMRDGTHFVRI